MRNGTMLFIAVALTTCAPSQTEDGEVAQGLVQPGARCLDPADYGAVPDDGLDDRAAFQAALDDAEPFGMEVCPGPGQWDIARDPDAGTSHIPSLTLRGDGDALIGAGESATILSYLGDKPGDWDMVRVTGSHHRVANLKIDGSSRGVTGEQTHSIEVWHARDTQIDHVRFNFPVIPGNGGGDCIRLLGELATPVDGVSISDVWMDECDRSGVGFQRAVSNVFITRLHVAKVGDQVLDQEPTGTGTIGTVSVRDSELYSQHGGINSTITGGDGPSAGIVFDNVSMDGQIFINHGEDVQLRNMRITTTDTSAVGAISSGAGILIDGGRFERLAGITGPVLSFSAHASSWPTDVVVRNARVIQNTDAPAIKFTPSYGVDIEGGTVDCRGPTPATSAAVQMDSVGARAEDLKVRGLTVRGTCKYGVWVQGGTTGAGAFVVADNLFHLAPTTGPAPTAGVRYDGATPIVKPTIVGNVTSSGVGTAQPASVLPASLLYSTGNTP